MLPFPPTECLTSGPHAETAAKGCLPELPMLHLLAPEVKCPACGASLMFVVRGGYGDLYQCKCKHQVMHYLNTDTKTCGYAIIRPSRAFGAWTACDMPAAKG